MNYDVIIVGAGASGLMAAITAARQGSSVLVIERKDKAGKKILATGNGKCNFTNIIQTPECYRSDDSAFAMKVLSCFDVANTLQFFEELGIYPKERGGYLYPNSEQAASVVRILMLECERLKVRFAFNETVLEIKKPHYTVQTEQLVEAESDKKVKNNKNKEVIKKTYYGIKLILSAGGCAAPQLGSDGSGYLLAKSIGHTLIKPVPALVQLKSSDKYLKTVSGVRTIAKVKAYANQKQIVQEEGELLFTDYGISGIPILQLSRFAAKALEQGSKVCLKIDFLPEIEKETLITMLQKRILQNSDKTLEELLIGILNHKLSYIIITEAKLDPMKRSKQMIKQDLELLAQQIKEFNMNISDTNSFENAQVSAGGISTGEIDPLTMESRLSKNLYLTGELLDVDGTCGGYNLQWAWSSGYLAGFNAGQKKIG